MQYNPDRAPYGTDPTSPRVQKSFQPGPGEALPLQSILLRFEGVIRVEGGLLRQVWNVTELAPANGLILGQCISTQALRLVFHKDPTINSAHTLACVY